MEYSSLYECLETKCVCNVQLIKFYLTQEISLLFRFSPLLPSALNGFIPYPLPSQPFLVIPLCSS
jgi:hypothetical protein